jgi:hypothetical protein
VSAPVVTDVELVRTTESEAAGLLGYLSFLIDSSLRVDGVTLRRTCSGKLTLSYPSRDTHRRRYFFLRPVDDRARRSIESQILAQLGLAGEEAS